MTSRTYTVDMRTDTLTVPTESMRRAMSEAAVGDDGFGEDPTVNAMESRVASLLGKEAALFVPSATMGNLIAIMVHCGEGGSECIAGDKSHVIQNELGGICTLSGVTVSPIKNTPDGTFDLEKLKSYITERDVTWTTTRMVAVENTHNRCGGQVLPMEWLNDLATFAKEFSLYLHMDGARVLNASQYLQISPSEIVKHFDSVTICFTKGLAAPVGSALVGPSLFIKKARRVRKILGGGMCQAGVIAAPIIISLEEMLPELIEDHRRAKSIARGIASDSSIFLVDLEAVQTNIILVHIEESSPLTAKELAARLLHVTAEEVGNGCRTEDGDGIVVRGRCFGDKTFRLITFHGISDVDVEYTVRKLNYVRKEFENLILLKLK